MNYKTLALCTCGVSPGPAIAPVLTLGNPLAVSLLGISLVVELQRVATFWALAARWCDK
jgi:hypothetical protein